MIKVKQAIVVEGRYDKNTLKQLIDAPIFTVDGFGVMHNRSRLNLLRQVAEKRGLIILTDSDGAGFVIRNYLKGALPRQGVLHAYIPDVYGKEKRKKKPGKEGKLGVEGMSQEILLQALRREPLSFDELIARTQFSAAKLNSLLTMLELKGIIDQSAGRTYATKS